MRAIRLALGLGLVGALLGPAQPAPAEDEASSPRSGSSSTSSTTRRAACCGTRPRPIERSQVSRDLGASEQRLRCFKTREPSAASIPLLERQLDRLNRPARVRSPGLARGLLRTD